MFFVLQIPDLPYIRRGHECRGEFKMSSPSPVMVSLHVSKKFSSGTLNPTQSNKPTKKYYSFGLYLTVMYEKVVRLELFVETRRIFFQTL